MLHHVTLWVPDLERAEASWTWLLTRLGYERDASMCLAKPEMNSRATGESARCDGWSAAI